MRLRLSICRNNLPTAELLWAVPDDRAHDAFTVAQLLEHVNDIIPLESPHWGLEDYAVEVGSYEALHFQKARDIFKDEDQVCIRYLTQPELRARHIAGRDQINANGQHLVDGIPFGKSYFSARKPGRPAVNIPPLKNPIAESTDGDELHGLLEDVPQLQGHIDDDDEHDEDFVAEQPAPKRRRLNSVKSDKSDKSVHFQDDKALVALPSDDDTEEEYQAPSGDDITSSSISDSSSDVSPHAAPARADGKMADKASIDDSSSDSDSSSDISSSDVSSSDVSSDALSEKSSSDDSSDSDSSSSDSGDSDSSSEPDEASSKAPAILAQAVSGNQNESPEPGRPPFQGLDRTKARNRRRRLGKLYKRNELQGAGKRLADPRNSRRADLVTAPSRQTEREPERLGVQTLEERKAALLKMLDTNNVLTDADSTLTDVEAVEGKGVDANTQGDAPNKAGKVGLGDKVQIPTVNALPENVAETSQKDTNEVADASAPKRKRIDVGSFRRLTMGSLGLRTPKNKEEEQKLRDKIAADASGRGKKKSYGEASKQEDEKEPEDLQDPDAWKSRVELMAFEVSDENVQQLSAPSFPFQQRWDPQQHYWQYEEYEQQYEPKKKSKKKSKRNNQTDEEPDQYYEPNENEDWGILDYDEPAEADAAQSQLLQETQDAQSMSGASSKHEKTDGQKNASDDFPSLPSDVTTLQNIVAEDIRTGSMVVYKEMEVSELTGWQPIISDYRRAKVLDTEEDAVYLQLAALDVPRKLPGKRSGNQDESKTFDVTEDGEEDPSRRWVEFPNIAELWLLQAALSDQAEDVQMTDGNGENSAASEADAHANGTEEENPGEGTTEAHSPDGKGEDAVAEH
ncbi:hypothetical protein SLS55_000413 [Diplodia seriata]|uniref:DUF7357 domain-containing protein n=1 Tax=Diplodia seriata TaxID=420778 RepID=A0ABR3CX73_9PEZI